MGTALFAKILRIVARWYGNPNIEEVSPQLFDDAVHGWQTGKFEGENVFQAKDPGGAIMQSASKTLDHVHSEGETPPKQPSQELAQPDKAGIRIDLTRIGGQK